MDKVVLPSYKRGPFKLYAGKGVWLDMLLTYAKGVFHPTAWAFDDFMRNPYQHDLQLIREKFKKARKNGSWGIWIFEFRILTRFTPICSYLATIN